MLKDKGLQQYFLDEVNKMGEYQFRFANKRSPFNRNKELALQLKKYNDASIEGFLRDPWIIKNMNETQHTQILDILSDPKQVNIFIGSKSV
jgi:secreted Zn-dependent insulinase-like peptidase